MRTNNKIIKIKQFKIFYNNTAQITYYRFRLLKNTTKNSITKTHINSTSNSNFTLLSCLKYFNRLEQTFGLH